MRPRPSRATIKEVASEAGVSTQTVSRVINGRPDVSPETRERVKSAIERMRYQPSALARSLIQQRSYTLGVVTAGLKYIGPSRTLSGITAAAEQAGYALLLKELPRFDTDDVSPIFEALLSRHVDGIIWAVPEVGENRNPVNRLPMDLNIPIVYMTMHPQENLSVVSVDNYLGGRMATTHLIQQGYRHIAHISGPLDWWEARQRMTGWKDALLESGFDVQDHYFAEGNWSSASGAHAVEKLFLQYPEMDAIFIANDQMALSVLQRACQRGPNVPEELGIIGFDDIPESAFYWPPLSTIQQDNHNVARIAVEQIIKIIEANWQGLEPVQARSIMLTPTLVVRQSSLRSANSAKEVHG
ncbi:MAG: LacI family DNA-binding transcriptional regulator [Anaerolineales bacterium]